RCVAIFAKLRRLRSRSCNVTTTGMWLAFSCSSSRQGDGMPPNYYKIGFLLFSLSALDAFAAPLITAATLYAATQVFGLEFTHPYLLLAILAALLSYTLVRQESLQHGVFMSGWALATRAGFAWLAV